MGLKDIWWSVDDHVWDLLDALRLGDFFDSHNIPPILFPLMLVVIIAVGYFFLIMPAPVPMVSGFCGDGSCKSLAGEDPNSCPVDCPTIPTSNDIVVRIRGAKDCNVFEIFLKDSKGKLLGDPITTTKKTAKFEKVPIEEVHAELSSPASDLSPIESEGINTLKESVIVLDVPNNYCGQEDQTEDGRPGNIIVNVFNANAGTPISAKVYLFDSGKSKVAEYDVTESYQFNGLDSDNYYYLTAGAKGYKSYDGVNEKIYLGPSKSVTKDIFLSPLKSANDATGKIEVCVTGDGKAVEHSGELGIFDVSDNLISVGKLTDCPLFRGLATNKGCIIFTLPAEQQYYAAVTRAPSGCTISGRKGPIQVEQNKKELVVLPLNCSKIGSIRAIVYANDHIVTDDCKVELYHINDTKITTMSMSDDDEHTEYIALDDKTQVYIYAKSVPQGYSATISDVVEIDASKNKTIRIDLEELHDTVYQTCIQPIKLKINGSGNDEFVQYLIEGIYGGTSPQTLTYDSDGEGPFSMKNISIPGYIDEPGPLNELDGITVSLYLDSELGNLSATASCNLKCGDDLGDLNDDSTVNDQDNEILKSIIDSLEILGNIPYPDIPGGWPPKCADINRDGTITREDLRCLSSAFQDCVSCEETVSEHASEYEICNDGYDNNCDGQTDADNYDEEAGNYYGDDKYDVCTCVNYTPCGMKRDPTGGLSIFDETTAQSCRSLSDMNAGEYHWYAPIELNCTSDRDAATMSCSGSQYRCSYNETGSSWNWFKT